MIVEQKSLIVGVPREIKDGERRVALTPKSVREVVNQGSRVFVEANAGVGSGFPNEAYTTAGAKIISSASEIWERSDLIVKVKEPLGPEARRIEDGEMAEKIIFTYLHLAGDQAEDLTRAFMSGRATGIAYETVSTINGKGRYRTPLLEPMSVIAGYLAVQKASQMLEATNGGRGIAMGPVYSLDNRPAKLLAIGGGFVGSSAADNALRYGAEVTILEANEARREEISNDPRFDGARVLESTSETLEENLQTSHISIGGIYTKGEKAKRIVTSTMLRNMMDRAVFVDVAIDQGGMTEDSKPTSHEKPLVDLDYDLMLYCVTNMPAALPVTATNALNVRTLPYVLALASGGLDALRGNYALARGLNVYRGNIVDEKVAEAHGFEYHPNPYLLN